MENKFIINDRLSIEPNFGGDWDEQDTNENFIFINEYNGDTYLSLNLKEAKVMVEVLQRIIDYYK